MSRSRRARHTEAEAKAKSPLLPARRRWGIAVSMAAGVLVLVVVAVVVPWGKWRRGRGAAVGPSPAAAMTGPMVAPEAEVFARYAGSASCRECHAAAYTNWSQSHHALAERLPAAGLDDAAFVPERNLADGTSVRWIEGGVYQVSAVDLSGKAQPHEVTRVIGHDPLRQFLVPFPGGRWQALADAYDPNHNEWFDVFGKEDRQPGEWGHWAGRGMNWNSQCAACHNTRLRKNYDEASDSYHTAMAEMSVGCESCHGPMKAHAQWERQYPKHAAEQKDPNLPRFTKDQTFETCGTCHSRRGELTGDFAPGDSYFDQYTLAAVDGSDVFYPDGQVHEEDYEFSAFVGSKMYAAGVRCADCHDPHTSKPMLTGNLLCMRCHAGGYPNAPIVDPATHTFHKADSPGSGCVNCHMPQTVYMQRHSRHDHGFTTPDPLLTRELNIPNACNRCHTDKDAGWALAAADKWYGAKMNRPARQRARAVAAARRGDEAGKGPLLALLADDKASWYWKSVATGLLGRWAGGDPAVLSALAQQLGHEHPQVRSAAVRAVGPLVAQAPSLRSWLGRLAAEDPSRGVRVAAAAELIRDSLDARSLAAREFVHFLDIQADQPNGQLQAAMLSASRRQTEQAVAHLRRAVEYDPRSGALRREAAVLYGTLGMPREALAQIQEACRLEPNNADYQYLLALTYNELGEKGQTIAALQRAVALEPRHARAWYNLALARRDAGETDAALEALGRAEAADPGDADIPYARAMLLFQLNRPAAARAAAQRALQLRPNDPGAIELLRGLSRE